MTDRTCLVAFYDIWPGNGAGLFLQPWTPHGAFAGHTCRIIFALCYITAAVTCKQEINKSTAMQFVILFRDAGMQYRALYAYNPDDEVANEVVVTKIHGTGPKQLSSKSMERFYK